MQIQVAVNVLFYKLTNPIREDPYVGFPIRKFLWSSNITYYNVLKFGDDPTVGSSIHISGLYQKYVQTMRFHQSDFTYGIGVSNLA